MQKIVLVIILLILVFVINLYTNKEHFNVCDRYDKCSKYNKKSYSQCYDSGECSVMVDLIGNTFCTSKKY